MVCLCGRELECLSSLQDMRIKQSKLAHDTKPVIPYHGSDKDVPMTPQPQRLRAHSTDPITCFSIQFNQSTDPITCLTIQYNQSTESHHVSY